MTFKATDEWYRTMAELEEGSDISAGPPPCEVKAEEKKDDDKPQP